MSKELLYATNNPGKFAEISKMGKFNGICVVSPKDLGISLDVPETGNSLEENATLKALAFLKISGGRIVLADDSGMEIDALNGEPGIHVRRWKDGVTRMDDEEIIDYCLLRMKNIPLEKRGAQTRTVLVLGQPNGETEIFDGILRGVIQERPGNFRIEGFPFESLLFITDWNMLLGEGYRLKAEEKGERLNHREKAFQKTIPRIKELIT